MGCCTPNSDGSAERVLLAPTERFRIPDGLTRLLAKVLGMMDMLRRLATSVSASLMRGLSMSPDERSMPSTGCSY